MNYGYATIDATSLDLSDATSQTVAGLWSRIKAAFDTGKPLIMVGAIYGTGKPISPMYVSAVCTDTDEVTIRTGNFVIVVSDASAALVTEISTT